MHLFIVTYLYISHLYILFVTYLYISINFSICLIIVFIFQFIYILINLFWVGLPVAVLDKITFYVQLSFLRFSDIFF